MRKILSREEKEKKDIRNRRIMGIVLGLIMLFSTAGYFVFDFSTSKTNTIEENGITFKQSESGGWDFSYGGNNYNSIYLPSQTRNISMLASKSISNFYNFPLYFSAMPIEDISQAAVQEIWKNIGSVTSRSIPTYACMEDNCSEIYPVKNCANDNVIVFKQSITNSSTITSDQKCIIVIYTYLEEDQVADALLYGLLGIK